MSANTSLKEIIQSNKPVLIDFFAEWCGPCRMIGPVIEELHHEYEGKALVGKVNVDANIDVASKFGVKSIPTILFIKNGQVVDKLVGAQPKHSFIKRIESHL